MHNDVTEKKQVALVSVFAAIFLTTIKVVVGLATGSLGILSEALHSGLDLVAAFVTYFCVRISDTPADEEHHYGHGKIENFSALMETILLFVTCGWIIYEALHRLITGKVHIEVNVWSYAVVLISIVIDLWRSRALLKAARKYNSQALEADALHFSTDIWSSGVVLLGLICSQIGWFYADAIAALIVAVIVLHVCYRLGRKSIDVLLDKAPRDIAVRVCAIVRQVPGITSFHDVKVRNSGADLFVDLTIHVNRHSSIEAAHNIAENVERKIKETLPRANVHVHEEPEDNMEQTHQSS